MSHLVGNLISKDFFYWLSWYIINSTPLKRTLSDEKYIKIMYRVSFGRKLNLDEPNSFNEKLQWLKLYDRNPIYTKLVDKFEVKTLINNILGGIVYQPLAVHGLQ